jgi:hypothetical protein
MKKEERIILNQIKTPDGTILRSMHRHDYVTHIDKNGLEYMVDGGHDYLRRNVHKTELSTLMRVKIALLKLIGKTWKDPLEYTELSVYDNAPFEVIRESFHRGGRGKDGLQPLTWVPMKEMSDEWLKACIKYNNDRGIGHSFANKMYRKELKYRKANKISISD